MLNAKFPHVAAMAVTLIILAGCERGQERKEISEPPLRAGSLAIPIDSAYIDDRPSLSSDGRRLVFVSGRTSAGRPNLKVFKAEWPEGQAPSEVTRLTTDDELGLERDAVISPDGQYVLINASIGGQSHLYLTDFIGDVSPLRVTDETAGYDAELSYAFSPDSKLIAWISRNLDAATSVLRIAEIVDHMRIGQVSEVKTSESFVSDFVWVATTPGYAMAIGSSPKGAGKFEYELVKFNNLLEAASTLRTSSLMKDVVPLTNVRPVANSQRLFVGRRILPAGSRQVRQVGDFQSDTPQIIDANSEIFSVSFGLDSASVDTDVFGELPGSDVLALGATSDNSAVFVLERNAWQCASDLEIRYGSSIVQAASDLSSFKRIVPRTGAVVGTWDVADDYCERVRSDQTLGVIDDRITSFSVNASATTQKFRMIYVSKFSEARDKDCNYLVGDAEILALDVDELSRSIYPLSSNPAPLESAVRGPGNEPCGV